ncbi:hypothetical protein HMPREF0004_3735 [Achromobacter piechaudii ATCC 43553]|uniref:Uncharacterized protein n=1 Tax=Achromobacter piechaudii ATCC 43553 TaxID=742159 RepID=D4XE38_9BURK|nr:hypothetical protein HMPREF0004_3735 [Achromobacter piechaudii ATCC 43553]
MKLIPAGRLGAGIGVLYLHCRGSGGRQGGIQARRGQGSVNAGAANGKAAHFTMRSSRRSPAARASTEQFHGIYPYS